MALELHIPRCIHSTPHFLHPPPLEKPLRIQIEGPSISMERLFPGIEWRTNPLSLKFPQLAGPELARITYQKLYGRKVRPEVVGDMVYLPIQYALASICLATNLHVRRIDYYGVTFDHLVPTDDLDPDVLQINIIEIEDDGGVYANEYMPFAVDPAEYIGKRILAVPRCCQKRKGTQDRARVNSSVIERDEAMLERKSK
ncbi:hypothetical protein M426DRAFT_265280 [Hypoxylon sp. CI-4A]|nr:hypothetical protein M426DRAFT_265280 [Hypoxylon sp. CI-4A]